MKPAFCRFFLFVFFQTPCIIEHQKRTGGETVKSFYHYLMKYRHPKPKDAISEFANHAYLDHGFPKIIVNDDI